jgi:hypothetical protein
VQEVAGFVDDSVGSWREHGQPLTPVWEGERGSIVDWKMKITYPLQSSPISGSSPC